MQYIRTFKVRFSTVPVEDMDALEPMHLDINGELVDAQWWDINRFMESRNLRLIQVVTYERGNFEPPLYIGIFEELQ